MKTRLTNRSLNNAIGFLSGILIVMILYGLSAAASAEDPTSSTYREHRVFQVKFFAAMAQESQESRDYAETYIGGLAHGIAWTVRAEGLPYNSDCIGNVSTSEAVDRLIRYAATYPDTNVGAWVVTYAMLACPASGEPSQSTQPIRY